MSDNKCSVCDLNKQYNEEYCKPCLLFKEEVHRSKLRLEAKIRRLKRQAKFNPDNLELDYPFNKQGD